MDGTAQAVAGGGIFDRARFARAADWLAVLVAVSFPWSTSASGILIGIWLLVMLPSIDGAVLRRSMVIAAAAIPAALFVYSVIGMAWGSASFADQLGSIKPFLRLLAFPLLFVQFRRSDRGWWVVGGFLGSCTVLLVLSWAFWLFPKISFRPDWYSGVPFKDYIIQSGEFLICAFGLTHLTISALREGRRGHALAFGLLAFAFLLNIVFVATARSTLIIFAALLVLLAFQRFNWKGIIGVFAAGVVLTGIAWASSPYLRERVLGVFQEISAYQNENAMTSAGLRLEFWKKSIQFIATAPVFGHGTGTVKELFRKAATGQGGASAAVTDQPHNQTLLIAIQLGIIGAALLYAVWLSHFLLFRGAGLAGWLGAGLVVHNVVACLFNSYLFEFTLGWIYVFGVGALGGMVLRQREAAANSDLAPGLERR